MSEFVSTPERDTSHGHEQTRETDYKAIRLALVVAALAVITAAASAMGQEVTPPIVRVEEDWVVEIGVPDPEGNAPQIINAMSSTDQLADVHAVFELNHSTLPEYTPGGYQIQCWSGDELLDYRYKPRYTVCATEGEVIRYTMSMRLVDGQVEFEAKNGTSTTWGEFGSVGYLRASASTTQSSFRLYSPEVSVQNSYVGYAAHRVKKFALKEVRYYSAGGLVSRDTTERVVHVHVPEVEALVD